MSTNKLKHLLVRASLPVLVLVAGVGAASVVMNSKPEPETVEAEPFLRKVQTVIASQQTHAMSIESQGTVEPARQISLIPQVSGVIEWASERFVNGGEFAAGELLLRIDARDYHLAVTTAEANVADAVQQLETAKAQSEQAEADWALLDNGKPTALALRKPQLAGAEARLLSARAELERARLQLQRTEIRAPFNGRLADKQVDFGQYITAGTQLGNFWSSDVMEVRLSLPEHDLQHLDISELAEGRGHIPVSMHSMNTAGNAHWSGVLVRSEAKIDNRTRNVILVARFSGEQLIADDGSSLVPGQFVKAEISGREYADVVRLPREALHNASTVFVVTADGRLHNQQVNLLEISDKHILVRDGLRSGMLVSISPLTASANGQQVLAVNAGEG